MPSALPGRQHPARAAPPAVPVSHHLEPARGQAADDRVRPRAAGRGPGRAVDADQAMADGRVPRQRRRIPGFRQADDRHHPADQIPARRPGRAAVRVRRAARGHGGAARDPAHHRRPPGLAGPAPGHGQAVARPDRGNRPLPAGVCPRLPDSAPDPAASRTPTAAPSPRSGSCSPRSPGARWTAARFTPTSPPTPRTTHTTASPAIALRDYTRDRHPGREVPRLVRPSARCSRPRGDDAWVPSNLEYQFAASAPLPSPAGAEKVYTASEYYQGGWTGTAWTWTPEPALGAVPGSGVTGLPADAPRTMIPVPVSFAGMPNTRWWAFEDHKTNFGDIDASTTDLAKLMFLEFALVYANDWFVIPYTLPAGAIATIRGFVVQNTFGERFWLTAAGSGADDAWQRWSMFTVNCRRRRRRRRTPAWCSCPPSPRSSRARSPRTSGCSATRWRTWCGGSKRRFPWPAGTASPAARLPGRPWPSIRPTPRRARAAAAERRGASVRYQVMNSRAGELDPVRAGPRRRRQPGDPAAAGRDAPDPRRRPQPASQGAAPDHAAAPRPGRVPPQPYFLHEEEVSRAGPGRPGLPAHPLDRRTRLHLAPRARQTGRGEGSSGLAFDQIISVPASS